jgi:Flp pilus assembly pilin Flp
MFIGRIKNVMNRFREFLTGASGASAVEYAIMLALIAAAIVTAVSLFGQEAGTLFGTNNGVANAIKVP